MDLSNRAQPLPPTPAPVTPIIAGRRRGGPARMPPAVLHPVYGGDAFFIWAEAPPGHAAHLRRRAGYVSDVRMHPRCLDAAEWPSRLGCDPGGMAVFVDLPLPTRDGQPLPSPAVAGDPSASGTLQSWTLSALRLPIAAALPWLVPDHPVLPDPGLRWGPGWPFWWEAAAMVRALVGDGAVAPTLAEWQAGYSQALWRAVPGRFEQRALAALAACAPPAALGLGTGPEDALYTFSMVYADALVRALAAECRGLARWRRPRRGQVASAGRWLSDLLVPVPVDLPERGMRAPVVRWMRDPAGVEAPGRLVLRLDEPEAEPGADEAAWVLAVYVESPAEPGVLQPAAEVWSGRDAAAQMALQRALEHASGTVPALADCLRRNSDAARLTTDQVWSLLSAGRARLEKMGITVLVPAWWRQRPPRATLRLESASSGLFGADSLVRFSWEVALGEGSVLSAEEFERLVARRTPLVRLSGGWVPLPPGTAEAMAARWRSGAAKGEAPAGRALLMALQAEAEAGTATDDGTDAQVQTPTVLANEVLRTMLAGLTRIPEELPEPEGFTGTLRPYQRRGTAWLHTRAALGLGGILADDMGLGKTVQMLALIARRAAERRAANKPPAPTLIVCPTSVVGNWAAECERFTPQLRAQVRLGAGRARGPQLAAACEGSDIVITSYPLLLRDAEDLAAVSWDGLILDEAQNVKNAHAKQAQAARRLPARYRFALTGTPVENALTDLWSLFAFVQPGYLGSAELFRKRLATPIERGGDQDALRTLRRLIGPLVLRRTKREPGVADELPEKVETVERCLLTREQAALYEAVARQLLARVQESTGMQRRAAVLLALLRLKQVCNHPAHYGVAGPLEGRSGKLSRLEELLAEVTAEGQRALVFTQFSSWGRRLADHLRARLPGCPVWNLDGATPAAERTRMITEFQGGDGAGVFVLSLKAGGAGLNLTAARHVFHFDRWWNPAVEQQATDRAYRIGQQHSVQVHALLSVGTLEENIDQLLRRKGELAAGVLGGGAESWLTELGDAELREVLMLRRSALEA